MKFNKLKIAIIVCFMLLAVFVPRQIVEANAVELPQQIIREATDIPDAEEDFELEEGEEEVPETSFEGFEISTSIISDEYLYSALLSEYKKVDSNYSGTTIYSDMFKSFTELNLDKKNITSLEGFEKLELDSLVSFSANLNNISTFKTEYFQNTDAGVFSRLSLAGNQLTSIDISIFPRLTYLNLSSNNFATIDLSAIEGKISGTELTINLANNKLDSMSDITLPSKRIGHINLNIINNQISDIKDIYFTDFYTMQIGVQSKNFDSVISKDTKTNMVVYKTGIENLVITVYKIDGEADELVAEITDEDITEDFLNLDLPVGEYEYVYTMNGEDVFSRNNIDRLYLDSHLFNIIPQKAIYTLTYKGKEYTELGKVTGKVTVKLSSSEDAKIFYQLNGGEWQEGTEIFCDKGGSYSINVKTVINGMESEVQNIWVRTSLNLYIPDALMLVLLVLLALVLFLVVLPIISKKYFKKD